MKIPERAGHNAYVWHYLNARTSACNSLTATELASGWQVVKQMTDDEVNCSDWLQQMLPTRKVRRQSSERQDETRKRWPMSEMTGKMIIFLKQFGCDYHDLYHAAIAFMCQWSGCDESVYTPERMNRIIDGVYYEYLDACDRPSAFMLSVDDCMRIRADDVTYDRYDAILAALMLVQVRGDGGKYVNGFTVDFCDR